ncbi:uncharacterized protein LOC115393372 [Salarias fasciatus]|uniref:Uncharacterized LOC115393372 n=1 Tax=Salarias fasciatus TaxID=181472 RepID=A0A672HAZ2_SALFA|nr:uncharacterized protein LOC115393372 [Salarias fasciatus]
MASVARGAPLSARADRGNFSALVEERRFQELVQRSRSLAHKILQAIPDTHKSCVYTETLKLNSSENAKLGRMAATIRLPDAPVLKVASENVTVEQSLKQMHEGLQLQEASLGSVAPRLEHKEKVMELQADVRDLAVQISMMLDLLQADSSSPPSVALHLPGEYEVQVAAHLTLARLQDFGRDVVRCLRILDRSGEDGADS